MRSSFLFSLAVAFCTLTGCASASDGAHVGKSAEAASSTADHAPMGAPALPHTGKGNEAIFAGGCFWCMESAFDKLEGVISATSGYTGGQTVSPSYDEVSSGSTGHAESVRVIFDPDKISYEKLLEVFWHNIDPTSEGGQFCDRGNQYRAEIFYLDASQKEKAEASKKAVEATKTFPEPIVTRITPAGPFYPAEEYHQDFWQKNPIRYYGYREGCGRDRRLKELWGTSH